MRTTPLILVVDDIEDNREIFRLRLEAKGYTVETAIDGEDALEKTKRLLPDLVLLDVMMPKMDGIQVVQHLKSDGSLPFIPVLLLTAKSDTKDVVAGLEAGADDYLTKPIDHTALAARVAAMLRIKLLQDQVVAQQDDLRRQASQLDALNRSLEQRVAAQVDELDRLSRLKRFLPHNVAETLIKSETEDKALDSHRADITVLFSDLRDFTTFSETSEPEDLIRFLREYHAEIGRTIFDHGGTLERFTGDSVMVFFNDPTPYDDHVLRGARLAIAIRENSSSIIEKWNRRGARLGLGIGIAAGYATLGRVGFERRFDYAAIGNVTNLAARICSVATAGQILVSARVASEVEREIAAQDRGNIALKGFAKETRVFELMP